MAQEFSLFNDYLKKSNLKLTKQRKEILRIFITTDRHLSVDDFYNIARKKNSRIGHATVFRTLKLLNEAGIARKVDLGDKIIRYEHKYGHQHHDHLICIKCGKFIETLDREIEKLQDKLCKKFNFLPRRHRLEIFGICKRCSYKK